MKNVLVELLSKLKEEKIYAEEQKRLKEEKEKLEKKDEDNEDLTQQLINEIEQVLDIFQSFAN